MKYEEYKDQLAKLQKEFEHKQWILSHQYAAANNPYSVGDIVTDHYQTVKIESIKTGYSSSRVPCCIYEGALLEKDGTPRKDNSKGSVWQSNIKSE